MNKMSMSFSQDVQDDLVLDDTFVGTFGFLNSQEGPSLVPISNSDLRLLSPSNGSDDTMPASSMADMANVYSEFKPISLRGPPERLGMRNNANFSVELASHNAHKKRFLYSTKVERLYVQMNQNFSVSFNWDPKYTQPDMYVRATVVFSDIDQSEKRVERCIQHIRDSAGLESHIAKNVLHSTREIGTEGVYYCGDADVADSWLSTVVHFTKTSTEACTHAYKFTCKNSCPTGINRRFISVIFQLENSVGEVYGRDIMKVKVCSCPGRDMVKDEEYEGVFKPGKKRVPSNRIPQIKNKRIKTEKDVEHPIMRTLPVVEVEHNAMVSGLRSMVDMMTNAARHDPSVADKYANSITQLNNHIASLVGRTTVPLLTPQ